MNLRNVLRAYSLLRQLSDDESALLNILRTLNDNDREQLVASMSDKPQKKSGKKSDGKGAGKSARGSSIESQLSSRRQGRDTAALKDITGESDGPLRDDPCTNCVYVFSHNVHHMPSLEGYHEFQPHTTTGKSNAQSAAGGGD